MNEGGCSMLTGRLGTTVIPRLQSPQDFVPIRVEGIVQSEPRCTRFLN